MPSRFQGFVAELSRRRVVRVVATYAIGTFGALQSADVIVSALGLPHALMTGLVVLTFVGLPVTAALAWVFDLTPEGVVRTPPLPSGGAGNIVGVPSISPAPPQRSRLALVLGALAILLGLAGALRWWQARHKAPLANDLVAVLPFSVGGSEQYGYLREGMAQLLSAGIGGGGALRTVDDRALARAIQESGGDPDDESGRVLARRFGAGLFVVGNVLEVKDRLRIHAQLYAAADEPGARPLADANAEGDAGALFAMVDELLQKLRPGLLASGQGAAGGPIVAMAQSGTNSLAALKAFIEGEGLLREGNEQGALQALQRAVAEDPDFALAQYRLAVVASWTGEIPLGRAALYHALGAREKLPRRERELIEAFAAYWRGRAKEAEQLYRAILDKNPDDAESWYQLGEVLYHDGPLQGRAEGEAKSCFARAAALEPAQRMYSIHLDQIARHDGDRAELARLDELQLKATPGDLAVQWERAWALGDEPKRLALESALAEPQALIKAALLSMNHSPDGEGLAAAERFFARALAAPGLSDELKSEALLGRSQIRLAEGRRAESRSQVAAAVAGQPDLESTVALRALLPFLPRDPSELRAALAGLPSEAALPAGIRSPIEGRMAHDYLAGRLAAALGDAAGAERAAGALRASNDADDSALGRDLSLAVRAHLAAAQGKSAEALALLEQMSGGVPLAVIGKPYLSGESDRWLRADLLAAAGRTEEALRWFESVQGDTAGYWSAPVRLREAELLERLGKKKEALEQYRLFADLWKDCDPALRPMVEGARARMALLAGG